MKITTNKSKRGRPKTPVVWPEGEFTADHAFVENQNRVSRVSIHNKINEELASGTIVRTSKVRPKIGRPSFLYTIVDSPETLSQESTEELNF